MLSGALMLGVKESLIVNIKIMLYSLGGRTAPMMK